MNRATLQLLYDDKVTFWEFKGWWNHPKIYFIAPAWRNNTPFVSCIPQGLYNVRRGDTADHEDVFEFLSVPGREGILIHPGNYASMVMIKGVPHLDSEGCFLPGFNIDRKTPMINESVKAMNYLRDNITGNFSIEVRFMMSPEVQ